MLRSSSQKTPKHDLFALQLTAQTALSAGLATAHDSFRLWRVRSGSIYYNFILILTTSTSIHNSGASRERANAPIHDSDGLTRAQSTTPTSIYILPNWDAAAALKSKDYNGSVQGGDLTNLQYKQHPSSSQDWTSSSL
jgi:hypothetical protein